MARSSRSGSWSWLSWCSSCVRAGRRFASPVVDVMEAADRVAAGDYETRVEERGPREVQRLGRSFNAMTERLGSNEARRRQLLADVAHELRTPLSVIQANLEALIDGVYPIDEAHLASVLDETKVMSRLLNDLQTLSTAEAGALTLHREPTEPHDADRRRRPIVRGAGERGRGPARDERRRTDRRRSRSTVCGSGRSSATCCRTRSDTRPRGGVGDGRGRSPRPTGSSSRSPTRGSGIATDRLPHVFDRFSKAPDSPGAGLGLAIAKSLVEAHGGRIRAESAPTGTTISFVLPR